MGTFGKENNDMTNLSKPYKDVIIAPAENGATSLRPYSVNAFARVRGVLKRVTAAIAAGEPFSSGNSVSTTVGDELKYLRDTTTQITTDLSDKGTLLATVTTSGTTVSFDASQYRKIKVFGTAGSFIFFNGDVDIEVAKTVKSTFPYWGIGQYDPSAQDKRRYCNVDCANIDSNTNTITISFSEITGVYVYGYK